MFWFVTACKLTLYIGITNYEKLLSIVHLLWTRLHFLVNSLLYLDHKSCEWLFQLSLHLFNCFRFQVKFQWSFIGTLLAISIPISLAYIYIYSQYDILYNANWNIVQYDIHMYAFVHMTLKNTTYVYLNDTMQLRFGRKFFPVTVCHLK